MEALAFVIIGAIRRGRVHAEILRLCRESQRIIGSRMDVKPIFPELIEAAAGVDATQGQDVFGSWFAPEHAGLFAAGAHHGLAAGFNDP